MRAMRRLVPIGIVAMLVGGAMSTHAAPPDPPSPPQARAARLQLEVTQSGELADAYAGQIAYLPDGKHWLAGEQREITVYEGLRRVRTIGDVWLDSEDTLAVSRDGKRLAAGGRIYAYADGKELFAARGDELSHHAEPGWEVAAALLSPDQAQCLAWLKYFPSRCCRDRGHRDSPSFKPASPVFVIDTATHKAAPLPIEGSRGEYRALAASDRWLVVGGVAPSAAVFDRRTLARVATLEEDGAWYSFAFSRDGRTLVGVHLGRWLVVHDTERFTRRARIEVLPDGKWISALALHPTLPVAAVSGWDGVLRLYSIAPADEGRLLWSRELGQASALAFSPRGDELLGAVSGSPKNRILRFSVKAK